MRKQAFARALALLGSFLVAPMASAETRIAPYIEAQQVLDAEFNNGGDVLTYTTVMAGIDGSITGKRVEAQVSYRYEHRIPWDNKISSEDAHSGLARARAHVVPDLLSMEGGAIAMRARSDVRGAPVFLSSDKNAATQVYGAFAGPDLKTHAGPLSVNASYRLAYVAVDDNATFALPTGQPPVDRFDHATSHDASLSVGMPSGRLPFGWTVTGGYTRESASQLDQHYTGKYVRGDVTVPVTPHLAITGGAGYEDIRVSQRSPLRDANGVPIFDTGGRLVTDPASPRQTSYETDGLIWDVGATWRPNRRITIQARGGERNGGRAITGSIDYQIRRHVALRVGVYDAIESFSRALTRGLAQLPTSFDVNRNLLTGDFGGCVFGNQPGTGACLGDVLQSITTANYRSRGVYAVMSGERGPWRYGFGGSYSEHKYLTSQIVGLFNVDGIVDKSFTYQADVSRRLSSVSEISGDVFANWYSSGFNGAPNVSNVGATISYSRELTNHLTGYVAAGAYNYRLQHVGSSNHGQLMAGLRYQF